MVFYILGVGSIGSLLAYQLRRIPNPPEVRLLFPPSSNVKALLYPSGLPPRKRVSVTVEKNGVEYTEEEYPVAVMRTWETSYTVFDPKKPRKKWSEVWWTKSVMKRRKIVEANKADFYFDRGRWWNRGPPSDVARRKVLGAANANLQMLQHLKDKISASSTVVILQNGMGQEDVISDAFWPDETQRPSFVIGTTLHGVHRKTKASFGKIHVVHAAEGPTNFAVIPNQASIEALLSFQENSDDPSPNPILDPSADTPVDPSKHLPSSPPPALTSLHATLTALTALPSTNVLPLSILRTLQLQKLTINCGINYLTAILDCFNGDLLRAPHLARTKATFRSLAEEASSAFFAESVRAGASYPEAQKSFPPNHPLGVDTLERRLWDATRATKKNVSSMLHDLRRERATETRYIAGYLLALGAKNGVSMPTVQALQDEMMAKSNLILEGRRLREMEKQEMFKLRREKEDEERVQWLQERKSRRQSVVTKRENRWGNEIVRQMSLSDPNHATVLSPYMEKRKEMLKRTAMAMERTKRKAQKGRRKMLARAAFIMNRLVEETKMNSEERIFHRNRFLEAVMAARHEQRLKADKAAREERLQARAKEKERQFVVTTLAKDS
ncbi:hypothetical protein BT69DRAFT_1278947 [Atractiella rhizophila]|nr:hypothetical protein BT69DRAFT_1278947 [Atractiella rhizophila]